MFCSLAQFGHLGLLQILVDFSKLQFSQDFKLKFCLDVETKIL